MTAQSIVCGACNAAVPYGRLSCPECGELLASVAGSRRTVAGPAASEATAVTAGHNGSTPSPVAATPTEPAVATDHTPDGRREPSVLLPVPGHPLPPQLPTAGPSASNGNGNGNGSGPTNAVVLPAPSPAPTAPAAAPLAAPTPAPVVAAPASAAPAALEPAAPVPAAVGAPGAYVPRPPITAIPSEPHAPARTWAGQSGPSVAAAAPVAGAEAVETDADRVGEFVRWLAVAGSALSAVGFLLPLANSSVIGATGVGFLDRWGLAGPFHIIVVFGPLAILGLALVAERVPLWIRVGLPGLGLGALMIGLVWPYLLVSELRAGPGAVAILVGAILLSVAGIGALVSDRHGGRDRAV